MKTTADEMITFHQGLGVEQSRLGIEGYVKSIVYGFICEVCRLSDHGVARLRRNGFPVYPCRHCEDHFNDKE